LVEQNLGLSKFLVKKMDSDNKAKLKQSINFEQLLDKIYEEIADKKKKRDLVTTLASALDYAKNLKKSSFKAIKTRISKYYKKKKINKD